MLDELRTILREGEPDQSPDLLKRWVSHVLDYHENNRLYHENIYQMNRIFQVMIPPRTQASVVFELQSRPADRLPSARQISAATNQFINTEETNRTLPSRTCPIALDEFCVGESLSRILFCSHVFKTNHLANWFQRSSLCPVCRHDILL